MTRSATGPFTLSGSFSATVSNFWWDYFLDGDLLGTQGRFRYEANTIRFSNPALVGAITPAGFELPTFAAVLVDGQFGGSDGPCPVPLPPDSYCTGFSMPPIASFSGELTTNGVALTGFDTSGSGFGRFSYAIVATAGSRTG